MTGIRLSLRAFKDLHFYSRYFQRPCSLTSSSAPRLACWRHCRHLSNCFRYRQPVASLPHTNTTGFLTNSPVIPFLYGVRHKGKKGQKHNKTRSAQEDDDDDDDDDDEVVVNREDDSDYEDEPVKDATIIKDYKDIEKAVQSLRFDVVLTAGSDLSRNKIEEAFYDGKLRLNGEKLWKKSRAVKVGDVLDLIVEENQNAGTVNVIRTILKDVLTDKTSTDKFKVLLRRWKKLTVPKVSEALKTTDMHTSHSNN